MVKTAQKAVFVWYSPCMKTDIIILAAGKGTRMQSDIPKVMAELRGKPLLCHLLDTVEASGVCDAPVIVVGYKREQVIDAMGPKYRYAVQEEQLGTGHAVRAAESFIGDSTGHVLVLYGDMPHLRPETIKAIAETQATSGAALTMATVSVQDFDEWRAGFKDFSRVIRREDGSIERTVEKKDATEEELKITEVNPCYFCFDKAWMWPRLKALKNQNAQAEYYLTDLVRMAVEEGAKIASVSIDPKEAFGVNTKEHLSLLESL